MYANVNLFVSSFRNQRHFSGVSLYEYIIRIKVRSKTLVYYMLK